MSDVSLTRLYILRATYLLLVVGLGLTMWPEIVSHDLTTPRLGGVVLALLGTVGLLALIGLLHPLKMLPLLMFELVWKAVWLAFFALPLWRAGAMDAATAQSVGECLFGVILMPIVIPWRYLVTSWFRSPMAPWRAAPSGQ